MNIKKKLSEMKDKIKKNPEAFVIAVTSTGIAIATTVACVITNEKLKKAWEGNKEILHRDLAVGKEVVYLSDETEQEILNGSKDVWFDVSGNRFDLILHTED